MTKSISIILAEQSAVCCFQTLIIFMFLGSVSLSIAANDPNEPYRGASLSGTNTYAQVQPTGSTFTLKNGTLTLTGNQGGVLFNSTARNPRMTLSSDEGDVTLVLQKGTFDGSIALGGNNYSSTLMVGAGATSNRPTVTLNGNLMGSNDGFSHVRTNGANLVITGAVGDSHYIGLLSALNGNINLTKDSGQHQVEIVRVASGMEIFSQTRLVIRYLDLYNGATVRGGSEIHINGVIGSTENRMRPGSLLTAEVSIFFLDPHHTRTGGIQEASGTIRAGANIGTYGNTFRSYDIMQGSGHLTIEAGGSIGGRTITADRISAGGTLVAGTDISSPSEISVDGPFSLTPNKTLTGTTIKAGLIAAGEVADIPGVSTPSRIEAGRMMVVRDAQGSTGNFTIHNGSFSITGTSGVGNAEYGAGGALISHNEAAWVGGNLDVNNNGASSFTTLGVGGTVRIGGGQLSGDTLKASGITLHNGIDANINSLTLSAPGTGMLQIGSSEDYKADNSAVKIATVNIKNVTLNGRDLNVGAGAGQAGAAISKFVINSTPGNLIDGNINVGHNGLLALGSNDVSSLRGLASKNGIANTTAILGVYAPVILGKNLNVDSDYDNLLQTNNSAKSVQRAGNDINFSNNSFLVIDGSQKGVNYTGKALPTASLSDDIPGAISSSSSTNAHVSGDSKIYIDHVTPGHTYVALGKNIVTTYQGSAWSGNNLFSSNPLLGLERLGNGMEGQFGVKEHAPEVKRISASGGVARMARAASEAMETAIFHRIKLGEEDLYRRSFALWALPIYEHIHHFGLDAGEGSYGYDGGIGGLAIGGDYSWENMLRVGLAFNIGAGYARSHGDAVTKNNLDFWGIGAYAVWKPSQFSLDADLNFSFSYDKLKQELPKEISRSELKADEQSWSMGAGLRAQYEFDTDYVIIRPHAGFRYFHLDSSPYDVSLNGQDVLHAHRAYQNVWTFPMGIVFTKNFKIADDYEITPLINLKVIPASGDIYVKNEIVYAGAHKGEELSTQVMDSITYGGRAGLEFRAGDFSLGVNYQAQFGSHTTNQGVFGVLRYEF